MDDNLDQTYLGQHADRAQAAAMELARRNAGIAPDAPEAATGEEAAAAADEQTSTLGKVVSGAGKVAADIGKGIAVEGVPQFLAGKTDAIKHTFMSLYDMGQWLSDTFPGNFEQPSQLEQAARERLSDPNALTIAGQPTTVTGNMIRKWSEFMFGFKRAQALTGTSAMGSVGAGALGSFFTADPDEGGIANLVQSFPALKNPVTQYLASDPNDPAVYNRLRHAVENAGFGLLAEGVARGVKAFANHRAAARATAEAEAAAPGQGTALVAQGEAQARQGQALVEAAGGMPDQPLVTMVMQEPMKATSVMQKNPLANTVDPGVPGAVLGKAIAGADRAFDDMIASAGVPKGMGFNINFARMGTDNIDEVTSQMAKAFKGQINEARRGTITLEAQKRMADNLGVSVESMIARPIGQALNAESLIASSMLFKASRNELVRLARIAEMPGASMADEFALRRQFALHQAVQESFLGARAEAGRALGALRIASEGGTAQYAKAIQDFWNMTGGSPGAKQLAAAIIDLDRAGVADGAINAAARRGWAGFGMDAAKELFTLGLLWRPATQIRNIVGNAAMVMQTDLDYALAKAFGNLRGEASVPGEVAAMIDGQMEGIKSGFRLAWKAIKSGETQFGGAITLDNSRMRAISSSRLATEMGMSAQRAEAFAQSGYGKAVDYIGNFVRLPGNFLTAGDDFFKQVNFSGRIAMEAHSQAAREGLTGAAFAARRAELIANPPQHIKMAAFDHANYATFHDAPGNLAQAVLSARNKAPPLTFVLPFVQTPSQLFRVGLEHTPLAPLVGQWRADFAAGGQARDLALAKMATGSAMLSVLYDWAGAGIITGKGPNGKAEREALERAGWQPNSVQIGGKFYGISGLGQLAPALSFAGQMAEVMRERELDPDAFDTIREWTGQIGAVLSASTIDQSFMQGFANLVGAVEDGSKTDGNMIAAFLEKQAGGMASMVPGMGLATSTRALWDPTYRDINNFADALADKLPKWRDSLPFERDLWGDVRAPQEVYGRFYNYASPFKVSDPKTANPVDRAMADLGIGIARIDKNTNIDGLPVNFRDFPKAYEYYVSQAGNEFKHPAWGMGAKDFLNSVVSGKNPLASALYDNQTDGPYGGKAEFIRDTVREYRAMAQQKLLAVAPEQFPDFDAKIKELRARWAEQRAPLKNVRPVIPNVKAIAPPEAPQRSGGSGFRVPSQ